DMQADPWVAIRANSLDGVVSGCVVYNDDFQRLVRLTQCRFDRTLDMAAAVERRNRDGHEGRPTAYPGPTAKGRQRGSQRSTASRKHRCATRCEVTFTIRASSWPLGYSRRARADPSV